MSEATVATAGSKFTPDVPPEVQARWELSRRDDLATVVGFSIAVPRHGTSSDDEWQWGLDPIGGMANEEFISAFEGGVNEILISEIRYLPPHSTISEETAGKFRSHPYSTGPATQEWPTIFFELYRDVRPVITDGSVLITWGLFLKGVWGATQRWIDHKKGEVIEARPDDLQAHVAANSLKLRLEFTLPSLLALCYEHLVATYGIGGEIEADTFPRSAFRSMVSTGHPTGNQSYLIRLAAGERQFYYLVDGYGTSREHYLLTGRDITLLPLPDLLRSGTTEYQSPEPSIRSRISGPTITRETPSI
jgi:hypothetical protein